MLILSRKSLERVAIGNGIVVTILQVRGSTVRLGIDAPHDIRIRRSELPPLPRASSVPQTARSGQPRSETTTTNESNL